MRIGLDFDNTLACYDEVFSAEAKKHGVVPNEWDGSKQDLKGRLSSVKDGDTLWQRLQGQVYGPSMYKASMFPSVARFLIRCRLHGYTVIIVSHKTEYGHFDSTKTSLREAALSWMSEQGFFNKNKFGILKENIFFESTRQEKVARINTLNLDVFIDDLEEVFAEDGFPEIKKILFSKASESSYCNIIYSNWSAIIEDLFGKTTDSEVKYFLQSMCDDEIKDIQQIQGGGNSRLYKIKTDNGFFALKDYPDLLVDPRPRLHTEVHASRMLEKFHKASKAIAFDEEQNIALYEWIDGEHLTYIHNEHITQALAFVENLKEFTVKDSHSTASEACLSANDIFVQIENRFQKHLAVKNHKLQSFLNTTFKPLWKDVRDWSEQYWPKNNLIEELPLVKQTLSLSDFGFHNALLQSDGALCFLDLEYFGRDDPVKLMADFVWHPAMHLETGHKIKWLKGCFVIFNKDPDLYARFCAAWPLYGLRWVMILLNEFQKEGWNKRVYANAMLETEILESQYKNKLEEQLVKASSICQEIREFNMESPYA